MSKIINFLLATAILIAPMSISAAQGQPLERQYCPGPGGSPEERAEHETILQQAILAELTYGGTANANRDTGDVCPGGQLSWSPPRDQWSIRPVPENVIQDAVTAARERFGGEFSISEDGYVSCQNDVTETDRIVGAYDFAVANGWLSLVVTIGVILVDGTVETEGLEVLRLINDEGDRILGVQGTDPWRFEQWVASYNDLIGRGCMFPFSVELAGAFFTPENVESMFVELDMEDSGRFGTVGHSLGGAVVQHLMVQREFGDALEHLRRYRGDEFEFRAYAFNSFGVTGDIPPESPTGWLTSVRVAGEVVERTEQDIERYLPEEHWRRQVGNIYRYGSNGGSLIDQFRLHRVAAVKRAVCGCLDGTSPEFEAGFRR